MNITHSTTMEDKNYDESLMCDNVSKRNTREGTKNEVYLFSSDSLESIEDLNETIGISENILNIAPISSEEVMRILTEPTVESGNDGSTKSSTSIADSVKQDEIECRDDKHKRCVH